MFPATLSQNGIIVSHHFGIDFMLFGIVLGHFGIVLGSPWASVWPWGSVCFAILA